MKKKEDEREGEGFEEALATLEASIRELESGQLTLDDSLLRYEAGLAAWKRCHRFLEGARQRIELIRRNAEGGPETEPLDLPG